MILEDIFVESYNDLTISYLKKNSRNELKNICFSYILNKKFFAITLVDGNNGGIFENEIAKWIGGSLCNQLMKGESLEKKDIKKIIKDINFKCQGYQLIKKQNNEEVSCCSAVIAIGDYTNMRFISIGDVRGKLIRAEKIIYKTIDDTIAHRLYECGNILYNEIGMVREKDMLLNSFGKEKKININISNKIKLRQNDLIILETKRAWENLNTEDIVNSAKYLVSSKILKKLNEEVLRNRMIEKDYSINCIEIKKIAPEIKKNLKEKVLHQVFR